MHKEQPVLGVLGQLLALVGWVAKLPVICLSTMVTCSPSLSVAKPLVRPAGSMAVEMVEHRTLRIGEAVAVALPMCASMRLEPAVSSWPPAEGVAVARLAVRLSIL